MKRIWIRQPIKKLAGIAMSAAFLTLVLCAWFLVTIVRPPLAVIPRESFAALLDNLSLDDSERTLLQAAYRLDAKGVYRRVPGLSNRDKIMAGEILKEAGLMRTDGLPNPVMSPNILPNPLDILAAFPRLAMGISEEETGFVWEKSLFFAIWVSLRRECIAFILVVCLALPLGILMSCSRYVRSFFNPGLVVGGFIPIAALIPLTLAFFGIGEIQKIIFLALGMFFVLLGLVIKEIDEVDNILLNTAYTLGFGQWKTIAFVVFPTALSRIWKHLSTVFGLGWGYIIFAEMINTGGGDSINGIGWLFIARQRRFKVADMFAIFFVIIFFAFLFSYLFKLGARLLFRHEKEARK